MANKTIKKFNQISHCCSLAVTFICHLANTWLTLKIRRKNRENIFFTHDKSVFSAFHSSVCRSGIGSTGTASWQPNCGRKRQTKDVSEGEWWSLGRHAVSKWWKSNQGCQDGFLWETGTTHLCCRVLVFPTGAPSPLICTHTQWNAKGPIYPPHCCNKMHFYWSHRYKCGEINLKYEIV